LSQVPNSVSLRPPILAHLFGFSPAESRVAATLLRGRKLSEIAVETGVRMATLRPQLSSVLKKVGVSRQADLIRILTSIPALPRADGD
jgi:DNA-binding NarL/FixJ family response regulator